MTDHAANISVERIVDRQTDGRQHTFCCGGHAGRFISPMYFHYLLFIPLPFHVLMILQILSGSCLSVREACRQLTQPRCPLYTDILTCSLVMCT